MQTLRPSRRFSTVSTRNFFTSAKRLHIASSLSYCSCWVLKRHVLFIAMYVTQTRRIVVSPITYIIHNIGRKDVWFVCIFFIECLSAVKSSVPLSEQIFITPLLCQMKSVHTPTSQTRTPLCPYHLDDRLDV